MFITPTETLQGILCESPPYTYEIQHIRLSDGETMIRIFDTPTMNELGMGGYTMTTTVPEGATGVAIMADGLHFSFEDENGEPTQEDVIIDPAALGAMLFISLLNGGK